MGIQYENWQILKEIIILLYIYYIFIYFKVLFRNAQREQIT